MKNTLRTIVFIFILGQLCYLGLPWWGLAPIAALAGWLFPQNALRSFAAGFLGGFLLWIAAALWMDIPNNGLLAAKIGNLFAGLSRWNILVLTGILGGLVSAFACLTGLWARALFKRA